MSTFCSKTQLTYLGRKEMADILHTAFSNAFSWMKIFEENIWILISLTYVPNGQMGARFEWIWLKYIYKELIKLKFVPKGLINNIQALVHIMAWRRPGDKPFSEPMMVNLLTHICVTRSQWVKVIFWSRAGIKLLSEPVYRRYSASVS